MSLSIDVEFGAANWDLRELQVPLYVCAIVTSQRRQVPIPSLSIGADRLRWQRGGGNFAPLEAHG